MENSNNKKGPDLPHKKKYSVEDEQPVRHLVHDLNNIFSRILSSVELLKNKIPENAEIISLLTGIENGAYLASEIIEDTYFESTGKQFGKRKININSLINEVISILSSQLSGRINFKTTLDHKIHFIEGKYSDFYRVIMNLIINASEAIKDKGEISIITQNITLDKIDQPDISLFESRRFVEIKIRDNGSGIDKSIIQYIFNDKFTTKSQKKNSGIGLAIVKKIVDDNNGIIKVISEKNKGAEFTLRFPAVDLKAVGKIKTSKSILIAEDEEIQRMLLAELLESYNYDVQAVPGGEKLFEELSKRNYDLIIIDRNMPGMDGITCIKKVKEMNLNIPIILATGSQSKDCDFSEIDKLADKFMKKPYNFDEMLNIIDELIG
jgi:two-component system, cell cycle sensor histidine kinase and response regulator CckA